MLECLQHDPAGQRDLADDALEWMHRQQCPPGERTRWIRSIAANAAGVHDRDVRAGIGPDGIGEEVSEIRFRGPEPDRLRVERHRR